MSIETTELIAKLARLKYTIETAIPAIANCGLVVDPDAHHFLPPVHRALKAHQPLALGNFIIYEIKP